MSMLSELIRNDEVSFEDISQLLKKDDRRGYKYVAELFLLQDNFKEAEICYRFINNYSALKFIQRLKTGSQN